MTARRKGFALHSPAAAGETGVSLSVAAQRVGVTTKQLEDLVRRNCMEPTYSVAEVAEHFGCGIWQVNKLVQLGLKHGAALDPQRGGLHPTFKVSHKSRRIPLSAIERHKRHMARAHDGVAA